MCIHIQAYLHHLLAKDILIERLTYIVGEDKLKRELEFSRYEAKIV